MLRLSPSMAFVESCRARLVKSGVKHIDLSERDSGRSLQLHSLCKIDLCARVLSYVGSASAFMVILCGGSRLRYVSLHVLGIGFLGSPDRDCLILRR